MTKEEIITGIWSNSKTIQVGFSVYTNYKYLDHYNSNFSQILENLFEAFIKQKVVILELLNNQIQNITLTDKSAKGFEHKHLENNIKIKSGIIESFHFSFLENFHNQIGINLKLKKESIEFFIPKYESNIMEWSKIITNAFAKDDPVEIEHLEGGLVYKINMK